MGDNTNRGWAGTLKQSFGTRRIAIGARCFTGGHRRIQGGGPGGHVPPRPFEIECFFKLFLLLVYVSWQFGLSINEYRGRRANVW